MAKGLISLCGMAALAWAYTAFVKYDMPEDRWLHIYCYSPKGKTYTVIPEHRLMDYVENLPKDTDCKVD